MKAPRWLHDDKEIVALLNAVLDRFDQQSSLDRQRPTWLVVERHLPSLARTDAQADQLWRFVQELESLNVLSIRRARRNHFDADWLGAKLGFNLEGESILREWLNRPALPPPMMQWRIAAQNNASSFTHDIAPLLERRITVDGRSDDEIIKALAKIGVVKVPATLRQLSAHAFWGDSKILDDRIDLIAALFPQVSIRERPIVVAAHLPLTIDAVLFIENQDTYTAAMGGEPRETQKMALVYLSGFRSTAQRIREREGARLHFSGELRHTEEFSLWWFNTRSNLLPAYFWGDLDFAGMQMLKSLRQRFGDVHAWQSGYSSMLTALATKGSKQAAHDSLQTDPEATGCEYADTVLLPAIRRLGFLDQENLGEGIP